LNWLLNRFDATLAMERERYRNWNPEAKLKESTFRLDPRPVINAAEEASVVVSFAWDLANFRARLA
jgi:hypothetical protein